MPDRTANNIDLFAGENAHAMKAGPEALDVEPFKHDLVGRPGVDDNGVRPGHQHARFDVIGANGDRLRDGHRSETTWIENVDFPACGGLGNGTGKSLAGRRATTGVGIVADARYPGPGRLRLSGIGIKDGSACDGKNRP